MVDDVTLEEAENILAEKREMLEKYPDKFLLKLGVKQWSYKVDVLKKENAELRDSLAALSDG